MGKETRKGVRMVRLDLSAPGAGLTSGRGSVAIGTFSLLPGGGAAFLGLLLPRSASVPAVDVVHGKLWSRPVSEDRPIDPSVSVDQLEAVMGMPVREIAEGLGELMGLKGQRPGSS